MITLNKNSLKYKDSDGNMRDSGVLFASDGENDYATKEELDQLSEEIVDNDGKIRYVENEKIYVGENVLGTATLGANWTESNGVYTHSNGSVEDLTFETNAELGEVYLLEFDTSYTANDFVRVGIGNTYRILCYNGTSHIAVPLVASGESTLYITPIESKYVGSISNIKLRKIQDDGEEVVLAIFNTITENHTKNYGFWNIFIGKYVAENAVGSTRSVGIGYATLKALQGGHRNIAIGTYVMSQMIGGERNVAIGADAMSLVKKAERCLALGESSMYNGKSRMNDIAIGSDALRGVENSETQNNVAIGDLSGNKVITAKNNVFVGYNSGYNVESGSSNTIIGASSTGAKTGNMNVVIGSQASYADGMSASVAIGYKAKATKSYQVVIGNNEDGWGKTLETLLTGDVTIRATDGTNKKIVFNSDGSVGWINV